MTQTKWADYWISQVRFNEKHTHIDSVRIHPDNVDNFWPPTQHSRKDIVDAIKKPITFVTITKDAEGKWQKWQSVFIISIGWVEYIKTVSDNTTNDNLDNLPEF